MEYDHHRHQTYRQRIARDAKRFGVADKNGDQKLDREDFADFLHPGISISRDSVLIEISKEFLDMSVLVCYVVLPRGGPPDERDCDGGDH